MSDGKPWDVKYEWRAVALLFIGFGLVGLDRFALNPLFPAMMKDLNLNYQDLGNIAAVTALAWGLASVYMGRISDKLGNRRVLIPAVILFSLMAGFTGLVSGLATLLMMRMVMGLAEGAFMPPSITATLQASKPSRRGFNFGVQQNGLPVIGLGLGPIIATQLLAVTGSWRVVFVIVAVPGLILAYLLYKTIRDNPPAAVDPAAAAAKGSWRVALRSRNVWLACGIMICMAGSLNVVIAMTPNYLVDHLKVTTQSMGLIMSGIGAGAFFGGVLLPGLSDRIGRKPVMLASNLAAVLGIYLFAASPADPTRLFLLIMLICGCAFSVIYINVGPLTMESVPPAVASTAVGLVVGVGEIIGGAVAPSFAGYIAQNRGIENVFSVAMVTAAFGIILILLLKETRRGAQAIQPTATETLASDA